VKEQKRIGVVDKSTMHDTVRKPPLCKSACITPAGQYLVTEDSSWEGREAQPCKQ
jgi:hypothetical protein